MTMFRIQAGSATAIEAESVFFEHGKGARDASDFYRTVLSVMNGRDATLKLEFYTKASIVISDHGLKATVNVSEQQQSNDRQDEAAGGAAGRQADGDHPEGSVRPG